MVGSESERAGVHRGRARVGVSCIAEREGAGAVFGEAACAADHTGVGGVAGGVRGEGEACEIQGPRTGDGSEVLVGSESQRAGVHRGRARVGVAGTRERERAGAVFGEAAAGAVGGEVVADGECLPGVHIEDCPAGFHDRRGLGDHRGGSAHIECAAVEIDRAGPVVEAYSSNREIAASCAVAEIDNRGGTGTANAKVESPADDGAAPADRQGADGGA